MQRKDILTQIEDARDVIPYDTFSQQQVITKLVQVRKGLFLNGEPFCNGTILILI